MEKSGRARRVILGALLFLVVVGAGLGIKLRIGFGPKLSPPPLLSVTPADAVLIRDVAVFTGTETTLRPHQDVLVQKDRIVSIAATGAATGAAVPQGAQIIDGQGRTLLPGFIDAHTHISGSGAGPWAPYRLPDEHNLQAYVYAGVTTAYALGGLAKELAALRKQIERGAIGPQIFYTHLPITAPGGHPIGVGKEIIPWPIPIFAAAMIKQPHDAASAESAVAATADQGVDFIKAIRDKLPPSLPEMSDEVLKTIVTAAHARKLKVFVHIGTIDDALAAARAGADVLAHGIYRGSVTREQAEELARLRIPVIYTLAGWVRTAQLARGQLAPTALDEATVPAEIRRTIFGEAGKAFTRSPALREFAEALFQNESLWQQNVRTLHAAGVPLLVGTDSPLPGIFPGSSYHAELRLLAEAGVPNAELLIAATSRAAEVLSLDCGRIEAGKAADLILVRGDPIANLDAAAQIELVVLRGRLVRRVN